MDSIQTVIKNYLWFMIFQVIGKVPEK